MSGSGRENLPVVWGGWETLPNVRKALLDIQKWSVHPPVSPGVVGRPSLMSGSVRETITDVREWSRGYPECTGVVGRSSWMSGSGRDSLPDV